MTFFLLAFFGLFASPSPASCPPADRSVSVVTLLPGHIVERGASMADLARLGSSVMVPGHSMHGLTVTEMTASFEADLRMSRLSDGSWCADVAAVEVRLGLSGPARVYVASELAESSCMYREIMAHELAHVSVTEAAVRDAALTAKTAVGSAMSGLPATGRTSAEASAAARAKIGAAVSSASREAVSRAARDNARLDTPESYARLGSSCR